MAYQKRVAIIALTFKEKRGPNPAGRQEKLVEYGMFTEAGLLHELRVMIKRDEGMLSVWLKDVEVVMLVDQGDA